MRTLGALAGLHPYVLLVAVSVNGLPVCRTTESGANVLWATALLCKVESLKNNEPRAIRVPHVPPVTKQLLCRL